MEGVQYGGSGVIVGAGVVGILLKLFVGGISNGVGVQPAIITRFKKRKLYNFGFSKVSC